MNNEFEDLNLELKDLTPEVKAKALEIFSELMKEKDLDQGTALKKAVIEAENWFLDEEG